MAFFIIKKMKIELKPIATVKNTRTKITDDFWGNVISEIELTVEFTERAVPEPPSKSGNFHR